MFSKSVKKTLYIVLLLLVLVVTVLAILPPSRLITDYRVNAEYQATAAYLVSNPVPLPRFIESVSPQPGAELHEGDEVCVTLVPGHFMRSDENYIEVRENAIENTKIIFNGHTLTLYSEVFVAIPGVIKEIINGQATGIIHYCFTPVLTSGLYLATIETEDLSGNEYNYTWAFIES